nr:hypothetical protein KPHV_28740 [Kitasatospora purpeofusca]
MFLTASTLATTFEHLADRLDGYTPTPQPGGHRDTQFLSTPEGRTIGARVTIDSATLQLWITAPGTRSGSPGYGQSGPLRPGHSYHAVLKLGGLDGDPAEIIHNTIVRDLLPVFDAKPSHLGHRPWQTPDSADGQPQPTDISPAVEPDIHPVAAPAELEQSASEPASPSAAEPPTTAEPGPDAKPARTSRKRTAPKADTTPTPAKTTTTRATKTTPTKAATARATKTTPAKAAAKPRARKAATKATAKS